MDLDDGMKILRRRHNTRGSCTRSRKGQYGNIKRKDGHGAMSTTDWTDKWTRLRVWEDKVERCTLLAQKETTRRIVGRKAIQYCVKTARGPRRSMIPESTYYEHRICTHTPRYNQGNWIETEFEQRANISPQVVLRNTRSLAAICPLRQTRHQSCTE